MSKVSRRTGLDKSLLVTSTKKRWIEILRTWCIEKLKTKMPFGYTQPQIWKNRIEELSNISRVQFYTQEQREFLNEMRSMWISEKNK